MFHATVTLENTEDGSNDVDDHRHGFVTRRRALAWGRAVAEASAARSPWCKFFVYVSGSLDPLRVKRKLEPRQPSR